MFSYARLYLQNVLLVCVFFLLSCAPTIPPKYTSRVDKSISFLQIKKSPQDYQGKVVLLGGTVLKTTNFKEGTEFEILQNPLNIYDVPEDQDESSGRFLGIYKGYLDTAIYRAGRRVTVVGKVAGAKTQKIDEIEYTYPYFEIQHITLWREDGAYSGQRTIIYERVPTWWYYPYVPYYPPR